jgi:GNAT superfamily N-acetyltransferase
MPRLSETHRPTTLFALEIHGAMHKMKQVRFLSREDSREVFSGKGKAMMSEHSTDVGMRRLWAADLTLFRDHLLRLDTDSRYERFGMVANDDFLIGYADRCFGIDDVIYGWFDDAGLIRAAGELRGVGHNLPLGFGGSAEAAFSVEKPWRRRGLGTELMARIVRAARNRRAETLYMSCLARNVAMQKLARKFSAELAFEPGETGARLKPKTASPVSVWKDMLGDASAYATAVLDLQRRTFAMRRM